ncbi:hypothetical protein SteCoe_36858 [Stentor coeruleus]|uniref:Uncharacterized protein n=1 Tax=Stentor coeruleus TaxID=5963 RepID=A0A1R2APK7_9CILI|nr:hypothetical protein SteCoe_36858 [Stentor coeruleus]
MWGLNLEEADSAEDSITNEIMISNVNILYYYLENPGNILDYNEAMKDVNEHLVVMKDEDLVIIDSVEYNKQ